MRRICVFCGSAEGARPAYRDAARALGRELATRGLGLVYGGGSVGLLGRARADARPRRPGGLRAGGIRRAAPRREERARAPRPVRRVARPGRPARLARPESDLRRAAPPRTL